MNTKEIYENAGFQLEPHRINQLASEICLETSRDKAFASKMKIEAVESIFPATLLDFGTQHLGTVDGGLLLTRICTSGLAEVSIEGAPHDFPLPRVVVRTDYPISACIGSQYAGWPFSVDDYFAMCSGPARMARGQEPVLEELSLVAPARDVVGIFESSQYPKIEHLEKFAKECHVELDRVYICIARTASLPGTIQVVARSIETTLHKMHELKLDLRMVKSAFGSAPLPPIAKDDLTSLGWTNDAILYGATVNLIVDCEDQELETNGPNIPSSASSDYGRPFIDIFNDYDRDFYKVDRMLFSPAKIVLNNVRTGRVFEFGKVRNDLLRTSFGLQA